jgi:hypothetical protein
LKPFLTELARNPVLRKKGSNVASKKGTLPMTDKESFPSSAVAQLVHTIFQGVVAFTAGIYTIGFVVVNSHFSKFGITDYGLVQARYVAAGLNYAAVHVSIAALVAVVFTVFTTSPRLVSLLAFTLVWILLGAATYIAGRQIDAALMTGMNALVIILLARHVSVGRTREHGNWYARILSYGVSPQSVLITLTTCAILLFTISTVTWGKSLWPLMGPTLGGGRPASALLVLKPDALPILDYQLIPLQNKQVSTQLPVLFEDSEGYVVLISLGSRDNTVAVKIPRSVVTTVIYAPVELGQIRILPKLLREPNKSDPASISPGPTPNSAEVPRKQ